MHNDLPRNGMGESQIIGRSNVINHDPNLIAFGGLPAVMTLAERVGLHDLVDEHVTVPGPAGG